MITFSLPLNEASKWFGDLTPESSLELFCSTPVACYRYWGVVRLCIKLS